MTSAPASIPRPAGGRASSPGLIDRRMLIGGIAASGAVALAGCGRGEGAAYEAAAEAARAALPVPAAMADLVRFATLAANSHNTQPWRFRLGDGRIDILPDLDRRTPVVDPDDHHLFVSLGCAAENLVLAAAARGFRAATEFADGDGGSVAVHLEAAAPLETPLFAAIPLRQSTRSDYDGKPVDGGAIDALAAAGTSDAVDVLPITGKPQIETVLGRIEEGNAAQIADKAYVTELKRWIRFNAGAAIETGDGLYSAVTGNPTAPTWIGRLVFGFFLDAKSANEAVARQVRSSAGLMVLVGGGNDRAHWFAVGRAYQRLALQAAALGLRQALVNQAVEVAAVRAKLASDLGIADRRPDLIVRFGHGPAMPRSLRRKPEAVIV